MIDANEVARVTEKQKAHAALIEFGKTHGFNLSMELRNQFADFLLAMNAEVGRDVALLQRQLVAA